MEPIIDPEYLLKFFSILTIIGQAMIFVWIVGLGMRRMQKRDNQITRMMARRGVMLALVVALFATLGSLSISELALLTPCKLCWFQRILMYPEVILLSVALWYKKDPASVLKAAAILALLGAVIALYHYLEQFGFAPVDLPCTTVGYSVACSNRFEATYSYVTIPLMSLTAFLMILFTLKMRDKTK